MSKPRLLDLFCGAGGATRGYQLAGFHVTGVDVNPQPHYVGDAFHQADAMTVPLDGFDAIHASPPCQRWTAYGRRSGVRTEEKPALIESTRARLHSAGVPYVIENVGGAPLRDPLMLCGSMFDPPLDVQRHRFFECWPTRRNELHPCRHKLWAPRFPQATNRTTPRRTVEVGVWRIPLIVQQRAMGIDWMTVEELSQAIPPVYTEWLGGQLLRSMAPMLVVPSASDRALVGAVTSHRPVSEIPVIFEADA